MRLFASLVDHLEQNDLVLSRTAITGAIDRSVSHNKKPPLLFGPKLEERVRANRELVAQFIIWQTHHKPDSEWEYVFSLTTLAHITGIGILPEGILRRWPYDVSGTLAGAGKSVPAQNIPSGIIDLGRRTFELSSSYEINDRLRKIASVEWDIGIGPLHPFYDGCGRVSRYFAVLVSLWNQLPLVRHSSRDEYFRCAKAGREAFGDYYVIQERMTLLSDDDYPAEERNGF